MYIYIYIYQKGTLCSVGVFSVGILPPIATQAVVGKVEQD